MSNKAAVTLLHVIESIDDGDLDEDPDVKEFYRRMEDRSARELEAMGQRFVEAGVEVHENLRFGKRAFEIVRYAEEHSVDLIVMSSHRLEAQRKSTNVVTLSYQVSLICDGPILLVK